MDSRWPHKDRTPGWHYDPSTGQYWADDSYRNFIEAGAEIRAFKKSLESSVEAPPTQSKRKRKKKKKPTNAMPKRKKGVVKRRNRRRMSRRWINPALRGRRLPFKQVVMIDSKSSVEHGFIIHNFTISDMAKEYMKTFEEFRCVGFSARFLPFNSTTAEGVYVAILLDQDGFDVTTADPMKYFTRVGDMPGSVVRHKSQGFILNWKPTEPDSRNWLKSHNSETNKILATMYIYTTSATENIKGTLVISGNILCRGEYWSAPAMCRRLNEALEFEISDAMNSADISRQN